MTLLKVDPAQIEEVRKQYENTPLWLKTPNGMSTKLTEQQWLVVHTSDFMRKFGNWFYITLKKLIEAVSPIAYSLPQTGENLEIYTSYKKEIAGWRNIVINWAIKKLPTDSPSSIGTIQISRTRLRDALAHGRGDLKFLILQDLDILIKNGVLYHVWKNGKYIFYNFAHPIKYDGIDFIARLVVKTDRNGNRFYDHEFSEKIKKDALPNGTGAMEKTTDNLTHLSSKNILQDILDVNEKSISIPLDPDTGEPAL